MRTPIGPAVLAGLCVVAGLSMLSSAAHGAIRVDALRTGVTEERTRVVLDLTQDGVTWRIEERSATGVAVFLPAVELAAGVRTDLRGVGRIEAGELRAEGAEGARLVLRFRSESRVHLFALSDPPRWVLDVKPVSGASPAESDAQGAPTVEDREEPTHEAGAPEAGAPDARAPEAVAPEERGEAEAAPPAVVAEPEPRPAPPVELSPAPERRGPRVVVIDPGHGGEDPGATGPELREKDVCLDVARRLHRELSAREGVHSVMTRTRDVLVPLRQRIQLADELEADLFISIHVNAAETAEAHGVEVFFLSLSGASDQASRELARLENEALSARAAEEVEESDDLPFALSLRQSDTLLRSSRAAETVLESFVARDLAENRGVRQAAFVVLKSVHVPSILVELGFASSEIDREKLKRDTHRQALAEALADGVTNYFQRFAPVRSGN